MTNRDRIDLMTDDEIAELMSDHCDNCIHDSATCWELGVSCHDGHKAWLQQEVPHG